MTRNQQKETEITIKKEITADDEIAEMKNRIKGLEDQMNKLMIEKGIVGAHALRGGREQETRCFYR